MSESKRFKKDHFYLEFESKIDQLRKQITKLNHDLTNANEFIYEECNELKRLVQLDTEERIAHLKQTNDIDINQDSNLSFELTKKINEINARNDHLINRIEKYEQETVNKCLLSPQYETFLNKLNQFRLKFDEFIVESQSKEDERIIKNLVNKIQIEVLESQFNELVKEVKHFIFDHKLFEYKQVNDTKCLYLQHFLTQFKEINLNQILDHNQSHDIKVNLISSNKYLISMKINYKESSLLVFDSLNNQIESTILLEYRHINTIRIVNNLIAIHCSINYCSNENFLVILNEKLELIEKKSIQSKFLIGADIEGLFLKDDIELGSECVKYDWKLNELNINFKFQMKNPNDAFYADLDDESFSIKQLEVHNEKIFIRPGSNLKQLSLNESVRIYDLNGRLVCDTKLNGEFRLDTVNNLLCVLVDDDKLVMFDLDYNSPSKEILILKNDLNFKNFMIDSNCYLHLFDKFELKIFVSNNKISI